MSCLRRGIHYRKTQIPMYQKSHSFYCKKLFAVALNFVQTRLHVCERRLRSLEEVSCGIQRRRPTSACVFRKYAFGIVDTKQHSYTEIRCITVEITRSKRIQALIHIMLTLKEITLINKFFRCI